jgi:hypothetical protein
MALWWSGWRWSIRGAITLGKRRLHLDEYKKGAEGRELIKSTLFIHATFSFSDADTRLPVERKVVPQDSTLKMGKVIDKYPMNTAPEWKGKEVEQLKFVEIAGGMLPESDENSGEIRQIFGRST